MTCAVRNPSMHARWFRLFPFRSPLLPESHVVFSSSGYLDVSVHRVPLLTLCIGVRILEVCSSGFPHSDISGSMDICSSPKLFAAYHVFHRLLVPRHPPCALLRLTNFLCHVASRQLVWVFIKFMVSDVSNIQMKVKNQIPLRLAITSR